MHRATPALAFAHLEIGGHRAALGCLTSRPEANRAASRYRSHQRFPACRLGIARRRHPDRSQFDKATLGRAATRVAAPALHLIRAFTTCRFSKVANDVQQVGLGLLFATFGPE